MFVSLRRWVRHGLGLLAFTLIFAACSSAGLPVSFDDQPDPETGIALVERNWNESCQVRLGEELGDEANAICACSYQEIKQTLTFENFVEVNDRLKDDPEALIKRSVEVPGSDEATIVDLVADCIAKS